MRSFTILSVLAVASLLAGCGGSQIGSSLGTDGIFSADKKQADTANWKPVITEESMMAAARTNSDDGVVAPGSDNCPVIQVEGGQRYVTFYEGNRIGDGTAVIHRGEITKTARECRVDEAQVVVKYGLAGRVLLGPKGKPGIVNLPATLVINDKAKSKVKAEPILVTVTISKQNPLAFFSVVKDVAIPIKAGTQPQDYTLTISFDKSKPGAS